jgi:hypothetical protein
LAPIAVAAVAAGVVNVAPAQAAGDIDLCVSVGRVAGFTGERFVTAVAVAMAESRCDPLARYDNGNSIDRGLWQINSYWHSEVSDSCAYNAQCNANAAYRISEQGGDWSPWTTYRTGAYRQFVAAARAAIGAAPPPIRAAKSINGDRYDDAIGIDSAGVAWVYHGTVGGGFNAGVRLGAGWGGFSRVGIGDANADGWADLFATQGTTLYYWPNRGNGTFSPAIQVGGGWSAIEYFSIVDVNGDNKADILARNGGHMYLHVGKGNGTFATADLVGTGWAGLLRHSGADADADGDGDIWATNSAGDLFYWKRNGTGYATAINVGGGWNAFDQMTTMDVNGDNKADIVAVKLSDNTLWQWLGTGAGGFGQGAKIGSGWASYRLATF